MDTIQPQQPVEKPALPKINWAYQAQQYGFALFVAAILFTVFSWYMAYRSGSYDLASANKVLADTGALLLGMVFLLGPVSRFFDRFDKYVQYRKELGIVGCLVIVTHGLITAFFLPARFTLVSLYTKSFWPFMFGLAGVLALVALLFISNNWAQRKLGTKQWWRLQNWGIRIIFVLTALHVGFLKWSRWVSWYQSGGAVTSAHPELPALDLLVGWFIGFILLVRLAECFGKKVGTIVWYVGLILLLIIYIQTFWWGAQFAK